MTAPREMPDADLVAAVATEVMGWERHDDVPALMLTSKWVNANANWGIDCDAWNPLRDANHCLGDVVGRMRELGHHITIEIGMSPDGDEVVRVTLEGPEDSGVASGVDLLRAICEAALEALSNGDG